MTLSLFMFEGAGQGATAAHGAQPKMAKHLGPAPFEPGFEANLAGASRRLQQAIGQRATLAAPTAPQAGSARGSHASNQRAAPHDAEHGTRSPRSREDPWRERGSSHPRHIARGPNGDHQRRQEATEERGDSNASQRQDARSESQTRQPAGNASEADGRSTDTQRTERSRHEESSPQSGSTEPRDAGEESAPSEPDANPAGGSRSQDEGEGLSLEAIVKQVRKLTEAAAKGGDSKSPAGTRGPGSLQNVVQQIQQALGNAMGAAGGALDAISAGSSGATSSGSGDAQSQGGGQQGGAAQMLATFAQLFNQSSGTAASSMSQFALTHTAHAALNGGGSAQAVLEGLQQVQAGDSSSANGRAGSAPQSQSQAGSGAPTNPSEVNAARLARGLQSAVQQRGGAVTLRLTPPDMGTVRIQLQIQGGAVNAQFHTQTESARQMLTQQLGQLRQALEGQGLTVDRLAAQTMNSSTQPSFQQAQQQAQHGGAQQQHADASPHDGRSRGEYGDGNRDGSNQPQEGAGEDPDADGNEAFDKVLNEFG